MVDNVLGTSCSCRHPLWGGGTIELSCPLVFNSFLTCQNCKQWGVFWAPDFLEVAGLNHLTGQLGARVAGGHHNLCMNKSSQGNQQTLKFFLSEIVCFSCWLFQEARSIAIIANGVMIPLKVLQRWSSANHYSQCGLDYSLWGGEKRANPSQC